MDPFPPIPPELLAALEARFPDRVPNPNDPDRLIWRKVGNVEVVRFLRETFEEQNDNILEPKVT